MTPDRPGRWSVRFTDGRTTIYHVDYATSERSLWVLHEEGAPNQAASSSVRQFTELLEQMGWGKWVERVGDLPEGAPRE